MKHYIYVDKEILDSYISQIYGGILKNEKSEHKIEKMNEKEVTTPEMKIKATIEGGIPKLLNGNLDGELASGTMVTNNSNSEVGNEVIEKIYHDNLLDNIEEYLKTNDLGVCTDVSDISKDSYVILKLPFNFYNNDYLKSIGNNKFKDSIIKFINIAKAGNSEKQIKEIKSGIEILNNFANLIENSNIPEYFVCAQNLIIPLKIDFFKESPNDIEFKYGGEVSVIGKVTKWCKNEDSKVGVLNEAFGKSLSDVKEEFNKIIIPNYKNCHIITPIALYFE